MHLSGTTSFVVLMSGVLCIYFECLRPGLIVPAILGSALLAVGGWHVIKSCSPSPIIIVFLVSAVLLWFAAFWRSTRFGAPLLATGSFVYAIWRLCDQCTALPRLPNLTAALFMSFLTSYLAYAGRRARQNKRQDV